MPKAGFEPACEVRIRSSSRHRVDHASDQEVSAASTNSATSALERHRAGIVTLSLLGDLITPASNHSLTGNLLLEIRSFVRHCFRLFFWRFFCNFMSHFFSFHLFIKTNFLLIGIRLDFMVHMSFRNGFLVFFFIE